MSPLFLPADPGKAKITTREDNPHCTTLQDNYMQKLPGETSAAVFFPRVHITSSIGFSYPQRLSNHLGDRHGCARGDQQFRKDVVANP